MHMCFYAGAHKSFQIEGKFDIEWDRRLDGLGFTFPMNKRSVFIINT